MAPANAALATTILAASVLWTLSQYTYRLRNAQTGWFAAHNSLPGSTVQQLLSVTKNPIKICNMIKLIGTKSKIAFVKKKFIALILLGKINLSKLSNHYKFVTKYVITCNWFFFLIYIYLRTKKLCFKKN